MKKTVSIIVVILVLAMQSGFAQSTHAATASDCTEASPGAYSMSDGNGGLIWVCPSNSASSPASSPAATPTDTPTNPYAGAAASDPFSAGNTPVTNTANPAPATPTPTPSTQTPGTCANGQAQKVDSSGKLLGCDLGYTPLEPIPGLTANSSGQSLDFASLLRNVYKIAITIGALFSVLMLTLSGVRYMMSEIVTDKERAKKRIWACVYGLILIAASWLILNTINPQLVTFSLTPVTSALGAPQTPAGAGAPAATTATSCSTNYICTSDNNAAINQAQAILANPAIASAPNAAQQAQLQAGLQDVQQEQQQCDQLNGAIVGTQGAQSPCLAETSSDNPYPANSGKLYTSCKNIQTLYGTQACYYAPLP